jgi:hypothetical protein
MLAETLCAEIVFGQFEFGNVPVSWSGTPFPVTVRSVAVQLQATVLVRSTEGLLLKPE